LKWEQLPNGKWKPLKEFKKSADGKYSPDDPVYKARALKAMKKVILNCDVCGNSTLAEPCVHHLPDGYQNEMRKKSYRKAMKDSKSITDKKTNGVLTSNS